MKSIRSFFLASVLLLGVAVSAKAQFIEDALRIAMPVESTGARSAAMGNAFIGVADDFSAIHWNPAGLGLLKDSEFALGLTNLNLTNDATYLGAVSSYDNSTTHLNSIGLALPFPVQRGSFVLAAGYNRLANYTGALKTDGFNSMSSIQRSLFDEQDADYDLAWNLGLEDTLLFTYQDQGQPGWKAILVDKNVYQVQEVLESGNLSQWAFGGSMEVGRDIFLGVTLNVLSGTYRYDRTFVETDPDNQHNGVIVGIDNLARNDFQRLEITQVADQEIGGWNAKFGFLYKLKDLARFGVTVQSPYSVTVTESWSMDGYSRFANSSLEYSIPTSNNEYDVSTGWVFGFGASVSPVDFARISADLELADYTEIEFGDATLARLSDLNKKIKNQLRATNNFRIGAEFGVPGTGLQLRGGFGYVYSPWRDDPSNYDIKTISAGIGYTFPERFQLNATMLSSSYNAQRFNYSDPDMAVPNSALIIDEKISRLALVFSLGYHF